MTHEYVRLPDPGDGLRLHLNENTAGCSPRVLAAMRAVTAHEAAFYPDYTRLHDACARHLGVPADRVLVTNGLDEGIHAAAFGWLQRREDGRARTAIVVEPAFDMYAACAEAAGALVVQVPPGPDFAFPLEATLAAIGPDTGVVYLTSPNNPTGIPVPREAVYAIAARLPEESLLFLDEAYVDFASSSFLPDLPRLANLVIGRTFAKAHGLAAVRAGAVVAAPGIIARLKRVVPPYGVNVFALAGILAALGDQERLAWYCAEVARSREMIYAFCARQRLTCWPSEANFVLVRVGDRARAVVAGMAARGVFIRDRTTEPGCAGCVRITAGVAEHTAACLAALEAVLCDAA
jgi:histidinol-phosphate aminotransferase